VDDTISLSEKYLEANSISLSLSLLTCPINRFTSRTRSRGGTVSSSDEPSKQATRSVMSSAALSSAVIASPLSAACFFRFFDGGLSDSPPAAFAFASGSRAAKKAAVSSSRSTAA
jgi:hypothetical protein